MKKVIKLGVIGAGSIAVKHLDVIKSIGDIKIEAITSRTISKSENLAKKYKIPNVNKNIKDLLRKNNLDAILIFVSAEEIFKVTMQVIKFKIPFFLEKPAGLNYFETKKLCTLSSKYKIKNMVGLNRRYYSIFKQGKKILKKKGGFKGILIEGHERIWKIKKVVKKKILKNWLFANSIHTIDLLRFFGGEIKRYKIFSNHSDYKKNFCISIKYKNGAVGTYVSNWNSPGGWSVKIFGDGFTLLFDPLEKGKFIFKSKKIVNLASSYHDKKYKPGFFLQMQSFKNLINGKKIDKDLINLKQYLSNIEMIKNI